MGLLNIIILFLTLRYVKIINGLYSQDLGGRWNLSTVNSAVRNFNATVPGGVYTDLMNNNIIGDVFYGYNDIETRWIAYQKWIYSKEFSVNETIIGENYINLILEGIDTFAKITINDKLIGISDNMFVRYVYDVKNVLKIGMNKIVIEFASPVESAQELYNEQLKLYEVPPTCVPKEYRGECHVNHIRKMQASFSWDWGPALPSVGIWRPIYIESYDSSLIRDVSIKTTRNDDTFDWNIDVRVYYGPNVKDDVKGNLIIKFCHDMGCLNVPFDLNISVNNDGDYVSMHVLKVNQNYVKLWWPNGYGNQHLYNIDINYINRDRTESSLKRYKIGFRVVELIQDELPSGRKFLFKINGRVIFAKGSNVIPINILPEGENSTTIRYLLQSAKDVNMNMLRVWGGGMYESDEFYEIADELGILIWQDFMFACSMYPTTEEFLKSVIQEVKHQVLRLQYHPSVILWAGNNENEGALRDNWYGTAYNFTLYKSDYVKLYVNTIKETLFKYDDSREFIVSSPTNGIESDEEGYVAKNPGSSFYGDVHYYNYLQNGWNKEIFPTPRFSSEYGYQSLPSIRTLMRVTSNISELNIGSRFLHHRQHHPNGYNEMEFMTKYQFNLNIKNEENYRDAYVYFSQIYQAMAIKSETEHYRSFMGILNDLSEGWTYGALYWQLNDVWVAPTWSGIDYHLNWKMLHYYANDFFSPLIITGHLNTDRSLDVYVVNEYRQIMNARVFLRVYKWQSFEEVLNSNLTMDIPLDISTKTNIGINQIDIFLNDSNCGTLETAKLNCFIILEVYDENNKSIAPTNYVFPSVLKDANISKSSIKISSVQQIDGKRFTIVIEVNAISLFIWFESDFRGTFSENGFVQTTPLKTIIFQSENDILLDDFTKSLVITHLMDPKYEQ